MEEREPSGSPRNKDVRARAIEWIKENGRPRYGQVAAMANIFGVTPRACQNWCGLAESGAAMKKIGRPSHLEEDIAAAKSAVLAVLEESGYTIGETRTYKRLAGKHSRRAVRGALRDLKLEHRTRVADEREARRLTVEFTAKDVQWCQDGTQLERTSAGVITTEVVRDAAT